MFNKATMLTKVLTTTVTVGAAAALLAACSSSGSGTKSSGSGTNKATGGTKSLLFVNPLPNNPQWSSAAKCMAAEAKVRGLDFTNTGPTGSGIDTTAMIQQIQQGIANKKSAIVTFPASNGFGPVLQQAQKAGIVTLTVLGTGTAGSGEDFNIGLNWTKIGQLFVAAVAKRPGQQNIGLVEDSPTGAGKDFTAGVKAAAGQASNVKVVGTVYTGDDPSKALGETTDLLTAHSDVNVIMTHEGTVTPGGIAAIKAKGRTGKVIFIGNGPANGGSQALDNGTAYALLVQDLCGASKIEVDAIADRLAGKTTKAGETPTILSGLPAALATKSDYKSYVAKGWG
jgi:ABC-type sugar transport system substrate-binding protein